MKWLKNGNLAKVVAFFVIAVVLTCTVAYAASGWQSPNDEPDSGKNGEGNNTPSTDETDENKDGTNQDNSNEEDTPVVKPIPEYLHYITGKEITLEQNYKKPICFVMSSDTPVYGISSSFMVVEIPVEDGKTRFLCFTDEATTIGKIGSIAPTRDYISNIASYFGSILVANGNDDMVDYSSKDLKDSFLNLTENIGYHYTEYGEFVYSNADLITALLKNSFVGTVKTEAPQIPYLFVGYYDEPILGTQNASSVVISYASGNSTELNYSAADGKYILSKNGSVRNDLLNDKACSYDNVFILSADSTTYETSEYTECVLNTMSGGKGQYISGGKMCEITWTVNADGSLLFLDENGEKLTVNRGTSYIAFTKSSKAADVIIK